MRRYKLFVSHSCRVPEEDFPDAASREAEVQRREDFLREVCRGLHQAGFRVLVDRGSEMEGGEDFDDHIFAGDDWNLRLNEWLAECHAAIVLFNTAALKHSDWVKKEAAILSWRRELDPDFKLVPVLLDGVTPDALRDGLYGVLRIANAQLVQHAADPPAIVQKAVAALGNPADDPPDTPLGRLENLIGAILTANANRQILEDTWERLGRPTRPQLGAEARRAFAPALARALIRNGPQALDSFRKVLGTLPRPPQEHADQLRDGLCCLWVATEAAGRIPVAGREGAAALNGNYVDDFTAEHYLARAWLLDIEVDCNPVRVAAAAWDAETIREAVRERFRTGRYARLAKDRLDRQIARRKTPIPVLLLNVHEPQRLPDPALLAEVRATFPSVIFLLDAGAHLQDWIPEDWALRPELGADDEDDALYECEETDRLLDRLYRRHA